MSGILPPADFIERLFELDQATPQRIAASENVVVLRDAEVQKLFSDSALRHSYFNLLSLSYFHVGQIKVTADVTGALQDFEASLVAANQVTGEDYDWWQSYVAGTVAYLKKDVPSLQAAIPKVSEVRNKEILGNFLRGLQERGTVDYITDYSKQSV